MYDKGEAEASIMLNMIMDHVELYNRKMDSLSDTREILEGMMNTDAFNEWDNQYMARKKLKVSSVDDTDVSIFYIIYLIFINLKIFSNTIELFKTLLNTFDYLFSGTVYDADDSTTKHDTIFQNKR